MSIFDRIRAGEFDAPAFPKRPAEPKNGNKPINQFTPEEMAEFVEEQNAFLEAKKEYDAARAKAYEDERNRAALFEKALQDEFGVSDKAHAVIYGKAYADAHHGGFGEMANAYSDLVDFASQIVELKSGIFA